MGVGKIKIKYNNYDVIKNYSYTFIIILITYLFIYLGKAYKINWYLKKKIVNNLTQNKIYKFKIAQI